MNADDIFGELSEAKRCLRKGDLKGCEEALIQAEKLWQAERDYWALIEAETVKAMSGVLTDPPHARIELVAPSHWHRRQENWRGDDYLEGATE